MFDSNKIWQYLQQHLNDREMTAVDEWINASDSNRQEFLEIKEIWESAGHIEESLGIQDNWDEFEKLIPDQTHRPRRLIALMGYAATILLIASIVLWFYLPKKEGLYKTYIANSQNEGLNLPDGSSLVLDSASSVHYFTRMDKELVTRKVFINGGGKFYIAKNNKLPFILEMDRTGIEVLGTIFTVQQEGSEKTTVENIEGLIKFFELAHVENAIILQQGQKFSFDGQDFKDEKKIIKAKSDYRKLYSVERIIEILFDKFDGKFNTGAYGYFDMDSKIRLDFDKSLEDIISQIEQQAIVVYIKTCPDCYEIRSIRNK